MDSDGELRLTIMATLAQEASRKKITVTHNPKGLCDRYLYPLFCLRCCVNFLLALFADGGLRSGY